MNARSRRSATAIGAGAILLWSSLGALTVSAGDVPPFQLVAMCFAIAGAGALAIVAARQRLATLRQPAAVWFTLVGGLFGFHALYFAALRLAPAAEANLVNYLWPLLIVLASAALPGERLQARHVAAAVCGLVGVVVLIAGQAAPMGSAGSGAGRWLGDAMALGSAIVWAGYSLAARRQRDIPTDVLAGACLATAVLAGLCHVAWEATLWPQTAGAWASVAAMGLGPLGAAFFLWDVGMKHGDIRVLGVLAYATPVLSTLLLVAIGRAPATLGLAAACGLIAGAAALARR